MGDTGAMIACIRLNTGRSGPWSYAALIGGAVLIGVAALGGCTAAAPPDPGATAHGANDPVMAAALQEPLLVDPDLSQLNAQHLAIVPPGPVIPPQPLDSSTASAP